ncbi:hypothetical protein N8T08_006818 [Aspergillus melleus]|uniref:Uncharacterized protein n=1 Tax=Aspergillus melleus TaxID=138277 RepID=A0ACC3AZP9_9EURO|nr:hypothetical protein N8T08_006818 [Aspergillus melleus]
MGFKGVILTYAREVVVDASKEKATSSEALSEAGKSLPNPSHHPDIEEWGQGVLETVEMVGKGDILALKLTGAGKHTSGSAGSTTTPTSRIRPR